MMKEKLIYDINRYISYLNNNGLFVTVHGKGISGLLEHNIHRNPFCSLVKTDPNAWQKCIQCQQKVLKEYKKEFFFGMCYAGVEEYVYFANDKIFVSVSGYGINEEKAIERIEYLSREYFLDKESLLYVYKNGLKKERENEEQLTTLIKPLCYMLNFLQFIILDIPERVETKSVLFDSMLNYVQFNFMNEITIRDIAQACACSQSTVCHVFKQYTGKSIKKYIDNLRINQAKRLLSTSDLPINRIAQLCGFSNINYFPTAFKKQIGISPTEYRRQINGS